MERIWYARLSRLLLVGLLLCTAATALGQTKAVIVLGEGTTLRTQEDTRLLIGIKGGRKFLSKSAKFDIVTAPENGTIRIQGIGQFLYTPNKDWNGTDAFRYMMLAGKTRTDPTRIVLIVRPVNDGPPIAKNLDITVEENGSVQVILLADDPDLNDRAGITYEIGKPPQRGEFVFDPGGNKSGRATYRPRSGFDGSDEFTYRARVGKQVSKPAVVTITISALPIPLVTVGIWIVVVLAMMVGIGIAIRRFLRERRAKEAKPKTAALPADEAARIKEKATPEAGIRVSMDSDAPITDIAQDRLGTGIVAMGLSMFMRNKDTKPPLTLAITGGWGSGKSSLMGMLMQSLNSTGFSTVWFNAWHHHAEEHLFGALLEAIRREAVPRLWQFSGLIFRARLLWRRMWRHPVWWVLTALVVFVLPASGDAKVLIAAITGFLHGGQENWIEHTWNNPEKYGGAAVAAAGGLAWLKSLGNGLSAFGVRPGRLFRRAHRAMSVINVDADPGLRYRVNQALGDVTWALGRRTLVIFIDDLDRCPPDKVFHVLETVNFLCSTPRKSFVVLGMATDIVLPSISTTFSRIVEEKFEEDEALTDDRRERRLKTARKGHARNYLEKMINLELNVPEPESQGLAKLLGPASTNIKRGESRGEMIQLALRIFDRYVFPVLLVAMLVGGAAYFTRSFSQQNGNPGSKFPESKKEDQVRGPNAGLAGGTTRRKNDEIITPPTYKPSDGVEISNQNLVLGLIGLGFLGVLIWAVARGARKATEVQDEPDFQNALTVWEPAIVRYNCTPRHYKQSVNQLRLFAIRAQLARGQQLGGTKGEETLPGTTPDAVIRYVVLKGLRNLGLDAGEFSEAANTAGLYGMKGKTLEQYVKAWPDIVTKLMKNLKKVLASKPSNVEESGVGDHRAKGAAKLNEEGQQTFDILRACLAAHHSRFKTHSIEQGWEIWPNENDTELYDDLMKDITLH